MPIYEFKCQKCGNEFEVFFTVQDKQDIDCPKCHENSVVKKLSKPNFKVNGYNAANGYSR